MLCLIIGTSTPYAQNQTSHSVKIALPEVTLINIVSSTNNVVLLKGEVTTEAGKPVVFNQTDKSIWINYSSIIGSKTEPNRNVSVEISEGFVPIGLELAIKVSKDIGLGNGKMGKPIEEKQELSHNPIIIITEIESSNTGVGANKGYNVEYSLSRKNENSTFDKIDFNKASSLIITYTLSDY